MPTIDQLSQAGSIGDADELAVFSKQNGATRKATVAQLADAVLVAIEGAPDETIYSLTTDGNSFTVAVLPETPGGSAWALITLSIPAPAGTIILPGADDRAHGQEVLVTCTQAVAALTFNGSGAAVAGAPANLAANGFFRLRFDSISNTWYRIG
ncbi:hypothetical protein [Massilia phyllosphaerae]|uniref:hypothetical protein n=1 Tax=Massilia phyllosphaerae TaxID=3106034 RepID=UPI002B1CB310|nr:hypothetical protein [Massilia sp. SGZ-792]